MFDAVDERLMAWIQSATDAGAVSLELPAENAATSTVFAYMFSVEPVEGQSVNGAGEHQVWLRYLLSSWDSDPLQAHRRLGELVFAAIHDDELEVESNPPSLALWQALGIPPRPAIIARLRVMQTKDLRKPGPPVREPLAVRLIQSSPLRGVVVSPEGHPLSYAEVEIPSEGLRTRTDVDGAFYFAKVPTRARSRSLVVRAKGKERVFNLASKAMDGSALRVELD